LGTDLDPGAAVVRCTVGVVPGIERDKEGEGEEEGGVVEEEEEEEA
jgi:hypothetical protein